MIFFWYSQVTETAFRYGVYFIEDTLSNLNRFFIEESRETDVQAMFGEGIMQKGIPHKIQFMFTWLMFALIGIGVITLIRRYKEMSFLELEFKKPDFLKNKFEVGYSTIALACAGLLVAVVALPFISVGYGIDRIYAVAISVLSVFFVIGGIELSKNLSFIKKALPKKPYLSQKNNGNNATQQTFKKSLIKKHFASRSVGRENGSEVRAYLIILLVLIPYFFCVTGVMYNIFGVQRAIILNSEGEICDMYYVHDQESYGAKWLDEYKEKDMKGYLYSDSYGYIRLVSQGKIPPRLIDGHSLAKNKTSAGYIYLRYYNVVNGKLLGPGPGQPKYIIHNLSDYSPFFTERNKIYANGGSEVYK